MKQSVRIIAGKYRAKNITVPLSEGLRPTPQRVRETLFNWLMHDIRGAQVCDAFAGSGALGFEALSRGAAHVVLLEQSAHVARILHQTAQSLEAKQISIIQSDALNYLAHCQQVFDLIFLDPPFHSNLYEPCLELIQNKNILVNHGLLYIESASPLKLSSKYWHCLRQKKAGEVHYALYQKHNDNTLITIDRDSSN